MVLHKSQIYRCRGWKLLLRTSRRSKRACVPKGALSHGFQFLLGDLQLLLAKLNPGLGHLVVPFDEQLDARISVSWTDLPAWRDPWIHSIILWNRSCR